MSMLLIKSHIFYQVKLSTRGREVVKKVQNFVNVVCERPLTEKYFMTGKHSWLGCTISQPVKIDSNKVFSYAKDFQSLLS